MARPHRPDESEASRSSSGDKGCRRSRCARRALLRHPRTSEPKVPAAPRRGASTDALELTARAPTTSSAAPVARLPRDRRSQPWQRWANPVAILLPGDASRRRSPRRPTWPRCPSRKCRTPSTANTWSLRARPRRHVGAERRRAAPKAASPPARRRFAPRAPPAPLGPQDRAPTPQSPRRRHASEASSDRAAMRRRLCPRARQPRSGPARRDSRRGPRRCRRAPWAT
mmetsp:Transcript_18758/g.53761  ORF Transcript_18758/g.53761 Transcript_18758/m.53761 type:complete len:227 (+) Transcript_18758:38-718(+)